MSPTSYAPMTHEQHTERERLLSRIQPGDPLLVVEGLKKGRTAFFQRADGDNPWLLCVTIDRRPAVVRWNFVTRK